MPRNLLLVIGAPASGKTTLVQSLTEGLDWSIEKKPFWQTIYYDKRGYPICNQLGWNPEFGPGKEFGGTDRLAFDVIPKAVKVIRGFEHENILVEGDRLTAPRFIDSAMASGYNVQIAWLMLTPDVFLERQEKRTQDMTWAYGRVEKVRSIVDAYKPWVVTLHGNADPEAVYNEAVGKLTVARILHEAKDDGATARVPSPDQDSSGGAGAEAR